MVATSATSTTVADADRVVMNDNGTMVQVAVTDLAAYFDDEITAMPNLTSVGTLTALTVDDVAIDGKVMTMTGSSSDTFVVTVGTNGATSLVTTDAAAAAANLQITADGTVDIDGAVQLDSTLTIGANDQGYDVILYGDTASANMTWDTSADDLIFNGAARIVVPDGQLVLGSTAVTSTAAELNLLDGVSGLVQADLTKLAAVDSTAAELNIVDGGHKCYFYYCCRR